MEGRAWVEHPQAARQLSLSSHPLHPHHSLLKFRVPKYIVRAHIPRRLLNKFTNPRQGLDPCAGVARPRIQ